MSPLQRVFLFVGITFGVGGLFQYYIISKVGTVYSGVTAFMMFIPGIVAAALSYFDDQDFRDMAWGIPAARFFVPAYAVPALSAVVLLLILILLGIGEPAFYGQAAFMKAVIFQPTLGVLITALPVAGFEAGFRGYLHTQVLRARLSHPYLIVGLLVAIWHWPLLLFGDYGHSPLPMLETGLFTVAMVSFSIFLGWLRDSCYSFWPVVLAHATHLTWIQDIYPRFYKAGSLDPYFGGQTGFVLALIYLLIAIYVVLYKSDPD
ncbi:MAG: CPBP family glutamic-type intramembrane protease [Bdellovibrionales bacterium]